jgi:dTDP-4-dehydrorhamnose reductase
MSKLKILVTGSKGQLGNELRDLSINHSIFDFDFHDVDTLDITDLKSLENYFIANKPSFVINAAAYTAVDKAETDFDTAILINATAVANLSGMCSKFNARLIHVSTDYVFDGTSYKPYKEEDTVNPQSAYGKTKLEGEKEALKNPDSIVVRTSWLYSSYGNNFVKTVIRLATEREQLGMIFDQIGTPTYAADLASAIIQIVEKLSNDKNIKGGIFHFSNEGVCSWFDFAKAIIEYKGLNCKVNPILTSQYPLPAPRPHYSVLDKAKIKNTFEIQIPWWKDSLKKCIEKL